MNTIPQPKMVNSKEYRDNWDEIDWHRNPVVAPVIESEPEKPQAPIELEKISN